VGLSVIPSLPSVLGWSGPVVGSGHPGVPGVAAIQDLTSPSVAAERGPAVS
jgi:hypothetical protein